ncbi:hypothetical protein [Bacillus sp. Bos-x628]|uniref:hypothetical protein n=1 Tax=Bacillus maqinnsis TaxID=3229854 RepID=UPI00338FA1D1
MNYTMLFKNVLIIFTLMILVKYDKLSLITFGVANLFYLMLETIVLTIVKTTKFSNGKIK